MRADVTLTALKFGIAGALILALLGGCASPSGTRPMTQAEGRIRYPIQMAVWPRGISAAEERAEIAECSVGLREPPLQADDEMFLECMGNKGFRIRIYRQNYVLSNVGQPLPSAPPPAPTAAVPHAAPAPAHRAVPSSSPPFKISGLQLAKDGLSLYDAYEDGKKNCPKGDNYKKCMAGYIGVEGIGKIALDAVCSNQQAVRVQMNAWGFARQIPLFDEAASVLCIA
ncbi:hypothetical protein [Paraburkholderia domus]|uniref:hypothetical protein n=1 Tax=Paraburkholderia domus TaxID=2793075 RepID=UPI001913442C|nr:hypothetical protein [Paraburkholderia domus]MBK5061740.1 hypothetical protein [Burkholderia sp. R-70199]CAE6899581.1 hypothetical protein R70199_03613 [Paraburkholderia domus]